jgi:hypothetical protein
MPFDAYDDSLVPEGPVARLVRDEVTGCSLPGATRDAVKRLHADRRGAITMLFILLGFVFFTALAGVWNTGKATSARMHTQIVADTAAYGAATWISRGMNQITATNILIQRNATAFGISFDVMPLGIVWLILVISNWVEAVEEACAACLIACAACAAPVIAYIAAVEVPVVTNYIAQAWPVAAQGLAEFPDRIDELKEYQDAWIAAIPEVIEEQREKFEDYYGTKIRYTQPGEDDGEVELPVKEGNLITCMPTYAYRFYQKDDNIPDEYNFDLMVFGDGEGEWDNLKHIGMVLGWLLNGMNHHVLETQSGPLEMAPDSLDDWKKFSVVATAMSEEVSENYRVAPGIFEWAYSPQDVMIAYAQAETYNGPSETLSKVPGLGFITDMLPFRVWSFWGWQWQPRLTIGDQLQNALQDDQDMQDMWERIDFDTSLHDKIPEMANH